MPLISRTGMECKALNNKIEEKNEGRMHYQYITRTSGGLHLLPSCAMVLCNFQQLIYVLFSSPLSYNIFRMKFLGICSAFWGGNSGALQISGKFHTVSKEQQNRAASPYSASLCSKAWWVFTIFIYLLFRLHLMTQLAPFSKANHSVTFLR